MQSVVFAVLMLGLWFMLSWNRLVRLRRAVEESRALVDEGSPGAGDLHRVRVREYNARLASFPSRIVGRLFGFKPAVPTGVD